MGKKDTNGQISDVKDSQQPPAADAQTPDEAAQAPADGAADDTAQRAAQLADELRQTKDQLLRQAAEYQNFRRRTERERAEWSRRSQMQAIEPMLAVLDDFRRSLDAAEQAEEQETPGPAYKALKAGVELVYQNFSDALKKLGVAPIEAVGQPFDEHLHEAVMQQPAPEGTAPGVILHEVQRGYRLGDRVVRHSKVVVAA